MEIAKLILKFLDVLVWPVVILISLWMFRHHINAMLTRFSEGKEFELELGGQKLRVNMLERGIDQISTSMQEISAGDMGSSQLMKENISLFTELFQMPSINIRLLAKFYGAEVLNRSELKSKYKEAQIGLRRSGLAEFTDNSENIRLTLKGHKALEWIVGNS